MGKQNFNFYNAISPYHVRFFEGLHDMGNTKFDPKNENQIFQSPIYEYGKQPLKMKIKQYTDPLLNREILHVHNLGCPVTFKVSMDFKL